MAGPLTRWDPLAEITELSASAKWTSWSQARRVGGSGGVSGLGSC
jgi:hypothetical protein